MSSNIDRAPPAIGLGTGEPGVAIRRAPRAKVAFHFSLRTSNTVRQPFSSGSGSMGSPSIRKNAVSFSLRVFFRCRFLGLAPVDCQVSFPPLAGTSGTGLRGHCTQVRTSGTLHSSSDFGTSGTLHWTSGTLHAGLRGHCTQGLRGHCTGLRRDFGDTALRDFGDTGLRDFGDTGLRGHCTQGLRGRTSDFGDTALGTSGTLQSAMGKPIFWSRWGNGSALGPRP